jgi:protein ImuB
VPRDRFPGVAPVAASELWLGVHLPLAHESGRLAEWAPERLAERAQRFTPRVSLAPPDGLLLEVKGSLHLFGGIEGLRRAFTSECIQTGTGHSTPDSPPVMAFAPTPLAALVAARAGKPLVVTAMAQLVGQLASLPLATLRWPQDALDRLGRMGVRTIGQALRLPRSGFARRFGTEPLVTLDRLIGRVADLRTPFQARERFRRRRDLTYELENQDGLLAALAPLFVELGRFLEARQCGVLELECRLRHRSAPPTSCVLRLAAPSADISRLAELLGERLSRLTLPEPVRACELRSGSLVRRVMTSNNLWQPGEHGGGAGGESAELIERLRARLGPEAVYGLKVLPGHRPENAWGVAEVGQTAVKGSARRKPPVAHPHDISPWPAFHRPLWLLPAPRVLLERGGLPWKRGVLRLLSGPERIETGWWDGGEVTRDYYVARDIYGARLWIFRERVQPHRWFLHGVFG